MNQKIQFGKSIIEYSVIKSKRTKTSQIVVDKDNVIVRTPLRKSKSEIQDIVKEKAGWIFRKQFEFQKQKSSIVKPTYSNGSTLPYFGKNCLLIVKTRQKKSSIQFSNSKFLVLLESKRPLKKLVKVLYENWLNKKSNNYLFNRTLKLSSKSGIKPSKIVVKSLIDRWGSATKDGGINLNENLLKVPRDIIDYIIIHELCHLKVKNHSFRYWNLVRKFMPNYQNKIGWLDANSKHILR